MKEINVILHMVVMILCLIDNIHFKKAIVANAEAKIVCLATDYAKTAVVMTNVAVKSLGSCVWLPHQLTFYLWTLKFTEQFL